MQIRNRVCKDRENMSTKDLCSICMSSRRLDLYNNCKEGMSGTKSFYHIVWDSKVYNGSRTNSQE